MTLHVMTPEHVDFVAECFISKGYPYREAHNMAQETVEVAMGYYDPIFFVGPSADNPRYFIGAYVDTGNRAFLSVGALGPLGTTIYKDAYEWLNYLMNELQVRLLETYVWVEDLQKEWFLRAIGFKKSGIVPDKVDIPNKGSATAVGFYIRPQEFAAVSRQTFRDTLKKYRAHRDNLRAKRAM